MAEWNDPQTTRSPFGSAQPRIDGALLGAAGRDEGLRSYMLSIYNYMASGVMLSGVVALLFARSGMAEATFGSPLRWLIALAPLGFVMAMSFGLHKMQTSTLKTLFWGFFGGDGAIAFVDLLHLHRRVDCDHLLCHSRRVRGA